MSIMRHLFLTGAAVTVLSVSAQTERSVTVSLPGASDGEAKTVRLTAVRDNIIKVEATPEDSVPHKRASLVVVPQECEVSCTLTADSAAVTMETARLSVSMDKRDGRITYRDKRDGSIILRESDGGKAFRRYVSTQDRLPDTYRPTAPDELNYGKAEVTTISLADRTGYSWRLQFDGHEGEGIYGLGQHQSSEMNRAGRDEELYQYNTKVSVPFVMSTAGYGLLWDACSYGRWGNPDAYAQLCDIFRLYGSDGGEGSLTGTYTDRDGRQVTRAEDSLYYENIRETPRLPQGFRLDGARVTYAGYVEAPATDTYRFILYYAGYVKVYVDGRLVVPERWRKAWNPNTYKFDVALAGGRRTPVRVEWRPDGSESYIGLRVAKPLPEEERGRVSVWSEMSKDMTYYFIAGDDMDEIVSGYRTLTGKAPVIPKWALGFWQSRERYKTQRDVVDNMAEFRARGIPCDVIVQDWNYWAEPEWGSHVFDASRYPDPQAMLDTIHAMHGRFMISCWPKFYVTTANYKSLDANGWMYRQAVNDSIRDWIGRGYVGSFYDAYSSGARKMFWEQMDENLYSKYGMGIDAWWMDASEPNVRDCTPIDYRKQLCGPTALGTSDEYFNAYSLVNAAAIYAGQRSVNPDTRVFLLTRSGFAGLQRYSAATWSGDIATRWEDMRAQMAAGLNYSMSGLPFWGMDIGGFTTEERFAKAQKAYDKEGEESEDLKEWRELNARWHQFGCFVPLYRTHGQWPPREVWNIAPAGHPCYETIVAYDKLRYRMMPYIYSMAGWVYLHDYTIMRGLAMDFGADTAVRDISDQWMFGPAIMVCPVTTYMARSRDVYLPASCGWYDLYTGRYAPGGQTIDAAAPYDRIPVFAREGAIIPFGPETQWSDEKQPEHINIYVYAGRDAHFELYEDEGTNYNYEKGDYTTIDITYRDSERTLTVGERKGHYAGELLTRTFNVILVTPDSPKPLNLDNPAGVIVLYDGNATTVTL